MATKNSTLRILKTLALKAGYPVDKVRNLLKAATEAIMGGRPSGSIDQVNGPGVGKGPQGEVSGQINATPGAHADKKVEDQKAAAEEQSAEENNPTTPKPSP